MGGRVGPILGAVRSAHVALEPSGRPFSDDTRDPSLTSSCSRPPGSNDGSTWRAVGLGQRLLWRAVRSAHHRRRQVDPLATLVARHWRLYRLAGEWRLAMTDRPDGPSRWADATAHQVGSCSTPWTDECMQHEIYNFVWTYFMPTWCPLKVITFRWHVLLTFDHMWPWPLTLGAKPGDVTQSLCCSPRT